MKPSFTLPKKIRLYGLLWGVLLLGLLFVLVFDGAMEFVGFVLMGGGFLSSMRMMMPVQAEIRACYAQAVAGKKPLLAGVFYFARANFLFLGLLILWVAAQQKPVLATDLVEIQGSLASIQVVGEKNPSLKITLEQNSNQYGVHIFKIPEQKLQHIQTTLQAGQPIFLLIASSDQGAVNNPYVQLYGIRTETNTYLTPDELNTASSTNQQIGYLLGAFLAVVGLIYVLVGKLNVKQRTLN